MGLNKPYYQDEWVTIYNKDNADMCEVQAVDLVLTDIPFNLGLKYEDYYDKLVADDYAIACINWFNAMRDKAPAYIVKSPIKWLHIVLPIFNSVLGYKWVFAQSSPNSATAGFANLNLFSLYLLGGTFTQRPPYDFMVNTHNKLVTNHPAEMPVEPIKKLIAIFTQPGDTILDPFLGSGTMARAAKDLNRYCIGYEVSRSYCDMVVERLRQTVMLL